MTATGHALVGTGLAVSISNPVVGIPVAILSHIVCDLIPHWDTGTNRKKKSRSRFLIESIADVVISFVLPYIIIVTFFPKVSITYLYVMVISAQLIDWLTAPYLFLNWKSFPFDIPYKFQLSFDNRMDKPWGVIYQVLTVTVVLVASFLLYYN